MAAGNLLYAQSGGPTAVINATAAGVIDAARKHRKAVGKVFAARNGIIGALREQLYDLSGARGSCAPRRAAPSAPAASSSRASTRAGPITSG